MKKFEEFCTKIDKSSQKVTKDFDEKVNELKKMKKKPKDVEEHDQLERAETFKRDALFNNKFD